MKNACGVERGWWRREMEWGRWVYVREGGGDGEGFEVWRRAGCGMWDVGMGVLDGWGSVLVFLFHVWVWMRFVVCCLVGMGGL